MKVGEIWKLKLNNHVISLFDDPDNTIALPNKIKILSIDVPPDTIRVIEYPVMDRDMIWGFTVKEFIKYFCKDYDESR